MKLTTGLWDESGKSMGLNLKCSLYMSSNQQNLTIGSIRLKSDYRVVKISLTTGLGSYPVDYLFMVLLNFWSHFLSLRICTNLLKKRFTSCMPEVCSCSSLALLPGRLILCRSCITMFRKLQCVHGSTGIVWHTFSPLYDDISQNPFGHLTGTHVDLV